MEVSMPARSLLLWVCVCGSVSACGDERVYIGDGKPYQVALTAATMPVESSKNGSLYIVETHAELPIRAPSASELAALVSGVSRYKKLPFPRLPWVSRDDVALQVDFTLSNLDNAAHDIDVIINGQNEFDEYVPTVVDTEDALLPLHAQWERRYRLAAKSRIEVTVREDEFDEVAVDLATVVNGAPNSDEVVYFENKSDSDPRSIKYIPAVIPGLIGLRLGLRAMETAPVLLEATVRVRDVSDKLASDGQAQLHVTPKLFESVVPPT
jgi:hypothetical protein